MSGKGKRQHKFRNDKGKPSVGSKGRETLAQIDDNNEVIKLFKEYSVELTDKHDRYERIVKIGRDITIESKRIIFLLHNASVDVASEKRLQVFTEAETRLNNLVQKEFRAIATELNGLDSYLYLRAYTAGLQEFIEALLFLLYLSENTICTWSVIDKKFAFNEVASEDGADAASEVKLLFPEVEFILGIGDFTGELMRKCINSLGSGNIDDCFKICDFVKLLYTGFLGINNIGYKEINRKLYVLKQSLLKMEFVCYNIHVRGSEIPKHMLASVISTNNEINNDEDEGFF